MTHKTVVVEGRTDPPQVGTPEFREYVDREGDPNPDDYEQAERIKQALIWLNSNPADRAAKELEEKLTAPIRELQARLESFEQAWLRIEWSKVQQRTNLTLLWLIFACLIYINVVHPTLRVASAPTNFIRGAVGNVVSKIPGLNKFTLTSPTANSQRVVATAENWVGKEFNPGVSAQCAFFVRAVLRQAGVRVGVSRKAIDGNVRGDGGRSEGPGMARSFFGSDIGLLILNPKDLKPGDLVAFADTYGNWPKGSITHVGIYVGNSQIVDRPTAARPVQKRPISTFKFVAGVRPYAYGGGR